MTTPAIGTPLASATLGSVIQSIRAMIPDPTADPAVDGTGFSLATLTNWINSAMRTMAVTAPIVMDWYAVQSVQALDVYTLPQYILSVEQLWFDNLPCLRNPEYDSLFTTNISAVSYYFGPHTIAATPALSIQPAPNRTGQTTTLSTSIDDVATSIVGASLTSFRPYGFVGIENEIVAYRSSTPATNTLSPCVRGQGLTTAVSHNAGATITELNIFFKCSRLPRTVQGSTDPIDIPLGLVPLIDLYVMSKVREAEQDTQSALAMKQAWDQAMDKLTQKAAFKGIRQGIQIRTSLDPWLYGGRVFVP